MSLQKALCLICARPTADGAILAVHVDKEKLQTWFLIVCGHELPKEIAEEDKICYFCLWQAEFMCKLDDVMADAAVVWWPRNLDLDNEAKELRKNFLEGNANQCWVQLEKVKLPELEDEENRNPNHQWECIYCRNRFKYLNYFSVHIKKEHKEEAIRCENYQCVTYFHSLEEREEHNKNIHDQPKEQEKFECSFCGEEFEGTSAINHHIRSVHKEYRVKCTKIGCRSYFLTRIEMNTHFVSAHANGKAKIFQCNDCNYKTFNKYHMEQHVTGMHWPKSIKCPNCETMFSTDGNIRAHVKRQHTFKVCKICKLSVTVKRMRDTHLRMKTCNYCKFKFLCMGLYNSHLKACIERMILI